MCNGECGLDLCAICKNFKPNVSMYTRFCNLAEKYFMENYDYNKLKGFCRISGLAKESVLNSMRIKKGYSGHVKDLFTTNEEVELAFEMYKTFLNTYAYYTQR